MPLGKVILDFVNVVIVKVGVFMPFVSMAASMLILPFRIVLDITEFREIHRLKVKTGQR